MVGEDSPDKSEVLNSLAEKIRIERSGNVVNIYKPEGIFTIIYGIHTREQDPNQLPSDLDGVFLEAVSVGDYRVSIERFKKDTQYAKIIDALAEKNIQILIADLNFKSEDIFNQVENIESFLASGETIIGFVLLASIRLMKNQGKITRRRFLKIAGAGVGLWLLTPMNSAIATLVSDDKNIGKRESAVFQRINYKLHPEVDLFTTTLRNVIYAEKEEWFAKHLQSSKKPHFATILGGGHTSIEDQFGYSSSDGLAFLQSIKPLIKQVITPESFYRIEVNSYDSLSHKWNAQEGFEVPNLKELILQ